MTDTPKTPDRIWAWKDAEYDASLWNNHGDDRYTPGIAVEYLARDGETVAALVEALEMMLDAHDTIDLSAEGLPGMKEFAAAEARAALAKITDK